MASQRDLIAELPNPIIAINQAVKLRPDADVLFWADDGWLLAHEDLVRSHRGRWRISRRPPVPPRKDIHVVERTQPSGPNQTRGLGKRGVGGQCSGGSAINLAYLFGAAEIVLWGYDMGGDHWHRDYRRETGAGLYQQFIRHIEAMAPALEREGVRVWNASPSSALTCFPAWKKKRPDAGAGGR